MQSTRTLRPLLGLAALAALGMASALPAAAQSHSYDLTQGFSDADGGPSLVSEGGTQSASGYSFTANQGLNLTGGLSSLSSYSIDMVFSLASNQSPRNGYQKIIDFKGLGADAGLYDLSGNLNFYGSASGASPVFTPNQTEDILLTRDGATSVVTGYANGVQQFQFTDTAGNAVFSANSIEFFHDDNNTGNESPTGLVKSITLNAAPEPSPFAALALGISGLTILALRARKRRAV